MLYKMEEDNVGYNVPQCVQQQTKLDLTSTAATVLYTAPSSADFNASIVNSIIVSNDSGSSDTITLTITNDTDVFSLFNVKTINANTSVELLTRDLILQEGEILKATAATADRLHVVASVQEFAIHRTPQVDL